MTTNAVADEILASHDVSSEPCQEDICIETDVTKVENKNEITKDDPESEENNEETGAMYFKTTLRKNPYYVRFYVFWSKVIFMELLPYILLIGLNGYERKLLQVKW